MMQKEQKVNNSGNYDKTNPFSPTGIMFIDENGGGGGVRLRKRDRALGTRPLLAGKATHRRRVEPSSSKV
jgi:hypothetical protein